MASKLNIDGKIDLDDPSNFSDKVLSEKDTRSRLLNYAKQQGFYKELILLLHTWDQRMRLCSNEEERKAMGEVGANEIMSLMGKSGTITINNKIVYTDKK